VGGGYLTLEDGGEGGLEDGRGGLSIGEISDSGYLVFCKFDAMLRKAKTGKGNGGCRGRALVFINHSFGIVSLGRRELVCLKN